MMKREGRREVEAGESGEREPHTTTEVELVAATNSQL
jgi:hypothetical protein